MLGKALLPILGAAAVVGFLVFSSPAKATKKGGDADPFANVPDSHRGKRFLKNESTAKSGRRYTTHSTGPDARDDVFVIAVSKGKGSPWISYLAARSTSERRLHRAFASAATKAERDRLVAEMMADFGVTS